MIIRNTDAYVQAAIEGEVARLASAPIGDRNRSLFRATASLAELGLREGQILNHLRPVAESIGLRGRELYSTVKSGVKTGQANPRPVAGAEVNRGAPARRREGDPLPARSHPDAHGKRPTYFVAGDEGPRINREEIRRHVYRSAGTPVRIKIKFSDGRFANWYRVSDGRQSGWQSGKPEDYVPCPYVGGIDPSDPELSGDILYWPEGEKDCDTLGRLALPAFTFGGTGDGLPEGEVEVVRGRQLVILADNDGAGRTHAERKAALAHGVAASVRIIYFPELPPGGDVSDFLKTNSPDDLRERVAATPDWVPAAQSDPNEGVRAGRHLLTCNLSDVAAEKVEWIWPGRIAVGKLTMIAGEPGLGKSQLSIAVAAIVSTGGLWPDCDARASKGSVLILSAEDGVADTIRPRFDAAQGDASKVTLIRAVQAPGARQSFDLLGDLALLEKEIERLGDVRLVLIDPVSSYLGKIDSHKNADVRSVLEPMAEMAERLRVGILAVTHLSKGDGKAINRFVGSIAFVAAARTAFAVVADPEDDEGHRKLLLQVKNNIAPPQKGLAFRLYQREVAPELNGSYVGWDTSAPVTFTADSALLGGAGATEATAKDEAIEFLQDLLSAGPADVLDIEAAARASALLSDSKRLRESKPFRAAALQLCVIKSRSGFGPGSRYQWALPEAGANEGGQ